MIGRTQLRQLFGCELKDDLAGCFCVYGITVLVAQVEAREHPRPEGGNLLSGSPQTHLVLGFPVPPATAADATAEVAAAVLGDGMSSPLMAELRERRALVYYAACAADVLEPFGQFAVEASFAPDKLDELLTTVRVLLEAQARGIDAVDLERARHQLAVRLLHDAERPSRLVESAAMDLFSLGRVRAVAERVAQVQAVSGPAVQASFEAMLSAGLAAGLAGHVGRGVAEQARERLGVPG